MKRGPRSAVGRMACTLALSTTLAFTLRTAAQATLAPVVLPDAAPGEGDRASDVRAVQSALESKVVRERLKELGLSEKEIQSRLDKLSDRDVHQLALRARALNAGGHDDGGGLVFGLLLIALLVLLIIYLAKRI